MLIEDPLSVSDDYCGREGHLCRISFYHGLCPQGKSFESVAQSADNAEGEAALIQYCAAAI